MPPEHKLGVDQKAKANEIRFCALAVDGNTHPIGAGGGSCCRPIPGDYLRDTRLLCPRQVSSARRHDQATHATFVDRTI